MHNFHQKHLLAFLLALLMVFGITGAAAFASTSPVVSTELPDADRQLALLASAISDLEQPDGEITWYYTVTDFDRDGNLEFVAAAQHPQDRSTNLRVWEVIADRTAFTECSLVKDPEESFPDILTDAADTYYNAATDTWYYMLYDTVVLSDHEVFAVKTAVNLKDGEIRFDAYAVEHTLVSNGQRSVSHMDTNGIAISAEQYNASGNDAMAGCERSSTNFEWLTADMLDLAHLTDSFSVFMGKKAPSESFPVPKPAALDDPAATPTPTAAPVQQVFLSITKNPTNEIRTEDDTAYFVSAASAYESLSWTFVSPDGGEYSAQTMQSRWGGIGGLNSTTLSISNVKTGMNGWGAYCTFYYKGQAARTTTAYMYISAKPKPVTPASGSYSGAVTELSFSTVTVQVDGISTFTLSLDFCDIDGLLDIGAPASVVWDGQKIISCYIRGVQPPVPEYGSMSGKASEGGASFFIKLINGDEVLMDSWACEINVYGWMYDEAPCVVYYTDFPSVENIYKIEIFGAENDPYASEPQSEVGEVGNDEIEVNVESAPEYLENVEVNVEA